MITWAITAAYEALGTPAIILSAALIVAIGATITFVATRGRKNECTYNYLHLKMMAGVLVGAIISALIHFTYQNAQTGVVVIYIVLVLALAIANLIWAFAYPPTRNWRASNKRYYIWNVIRYLLHAELLAICCYHYISLVFRISALHSERSFNLNYGGSQLLTSIVQVPILIGLTFLILLVAVLAIRKTRFVGLIILLLALVIYLVGLKWCRFGEDLQPAKANEKETSETATVTPTPTDAPEKVTTIPDNAELQELTRSYNEQLLIAKLREYKLEGAKINLDGDGQKRLFTEAVSTPFQNNKDVGEAVKELLAEAKTNPVVEANLFIALKNCEFFNDYEFVNGYFEDYFDKNNHLLISNMIDSDGVFYQSRNQKTLFMILLLEAYNKAYFTEGFETEKVVRLDTHGFMKRDGYDIDGLVIELKEYNESQKYQKYLVLQYEKKNGEKAKLYFDLYDKAFVIITEKTTPKPTTTPPPKTTPKPTNVVTEKPTPSPTGKPKKIITGEPTPTAISTPEPTPTGTIVTTTPTPDPTPTSTPTPKPTPTSTPAPTPTQELNKDPSKSQSSDDVKDDKGPGEYTGGHGTPQDSDKKETADSTDFSNYKELEKEIGTTGGNNTAEPTVAVTQIATEVSTCEDPSKTEVVIGKVDDEYEKPTRPGVAPGNYGTAEQDDVTVNGGKELKNSGEVNAPRVGAPDD